MQNTTNQPQSFYTKAPMGVPEASVKPNSSSGINPKDMNNSTPTQQSQPKTPNKNKRVFAVAGLVLFLIVAIMGVLIAQRQISKPGEDVTPVAPTAPESKPSAAIDNSNNCSVSFTVPGIQTGAAVCSNKTALTDYTKSNGQSILPNNSFKVGDEFVFSILVTQPSSGTATNVKVTDVLPNSLTFLEAASDPSYNIVRNGQTVTATIPEMGPTSQVRVEFKVVVNASNFGSHINVADVTNNDSGLTSGSKTKPNQCIYPFATLEGKVECLSKEIYDTKGELIVPGGALVRGKEYEYRVTVKVTNRVLSDIKVFDQLPKELEYVGPAPGSEEYIENDPTTGVLIANLGNIEDDEVTLGFIMKVPQNASSSDLENIAYAYKKPILIGQNDSNQTSEPPSDADICRVKNTILPVGTAACVSKKAYDSNGNEIASGAQISPGQEFKYKVTVKAEDLTTGPVVLKDVLPEGLIFVEDNSNTPGIVNNPEGTLTLDLGTMQAGQQKVVEFMVQLGANPKNSGFNNTATITTNNSTSHTCQLPLVLEGTYSCNSECENNSDCSDIGSNNHICYSSGDKKYCRLESNPESAACEPKGTPTPPPTGPGTPTPTPAPGCDELCVKNADCSNIEHVCLTTADGSNRCRLADYPDSLTCTTPAQPTLPPELPETGPQDWLNWLKAGLVTLGIGTALFLLL